MKVEIIKWWKSLSHDQRIKYATEVLEKRGSILKYNNDGGIIGFCASDIVNIYKKLNL